MSDLGTAKTIDQLPQKVSVLDSDFFVIDDGAQSYKVPVSMIIALVAQITNVEVVGVNTNQIKITLSKGSPFTVTVDDKTKQPKLTFDSAPTQNSSNPVTSGGIYEALQNVHIDIDSELSPTSDNPVTNAAITAAINNHTNSEQNPHNVTKQQVGLGNVENTADADKPISKAMQQWIDSLGLYVSGDGYICQKLKGES